MTSSGDSGKQTYQISGTKWSGYDLESFWGRLQYYREVTSPEKSFYSEDSIRTFAKEASALEKSKMNEKGEAHLTQQEFEDYRLKKLVMASSVSPDSGETIMWATRTSAFVPTNIPIIVGMLCSPPTQMYTVFWQWLNQTYNAGLNYGNRNASSTQTTSELLQAYCIATGTAIGVAGSLRAMSGLMLKGQTGGIAQFLTYFIGYAAVASSSSANVYAMRMGEIKSGVAVRDEEGNEYGQSAVAATEGIYKTMTCRCVYTIPIFFTPAVWNLALSKAKMMPSRMGLTRVLLESMGVALGLYIAMPVNCALFPQMSKIAVDQLEPEIQERAKAKNLTHLIYNKGL